MTDPRYRGLPFMAPLVPLVLDGRKTVTRRTGRKPAEVGDLLWIREAWRTSAEHDPRPYDEGDAQWWHDIPRGWAELGMEPSLPVVRYAADHPPGYPGAYWGRPRQARFLPMALARPWRGRVVSVERVPAPPEGIDDDEAIREGCREERAGDHGCPTWTLDGETYRRTSAAAFLAVWARLHPDPSAVHAGGVPGHVWRVEWVTEVAP